MRSVAWLTLLAVLAPAAILAQAAPAASEGVVSSASGSGHITVAGETRTFAFTATKRADGTVTGQVQVISRSLDTIAHLEIDCLRVVGNVAHMSGVTTFSSNPAEAPVGDMRRFVVKDNGEGSGTPDQISTIPANPAGQTCENSTLSVTREIEEGNIQVR